MSARYPLEVCPAQVASRRAVSRVRPVANRAGRVPIWVPLLLIAVALAVFLRALRAEMKQTGFERIDTSRAELLTDQEWVDPRWEIELAARVAEIPAFEPDDAEYERATLDRIAALPFVRHAEDMRVIWPAGLELWVELARPEACVRVDDVYYVVSDDGTLLSGAWSAPPYVETGWLPVIGPNDGSFDGWQPGMRLVEQRHRDALSVALSMWLELPAQSRDLLGRVVIDATLAQASSSAEPGVRLELEQGRVILFGRSPNIAAPGELPVARKWEHVALGLDLLTTDSFEDDWAVLDVRWDEPGIRLERELAPATSGSTSGAQTSGGS